MFGSRSMLVVTAMVAFLGVAVAAVAVAAEQNSPPTAKVEGPTMGAKTKSDAKAFDLRFVPKKFVVLIAVRPTVLERPDLKSAGPYVDAQLTSSLGLKVDQLEQVLYLYNTSGQSFLITTKRPVDWGKQLEASGRKFASESAEGRTLFRPKDANGERDPQVILALDDRHLILADQSTISGVLESIEAGETGPELGKAWQEASAADAALFLSFETIRLPPEALAQLPAFLSVLAEELNTLTGSARIAGDNQLKLRVVAQCGSSDAAKNCAGAMPEFRLFLLTQFGALEQTLKDQLAGKNEAKKKPFAVPEAAQPEQLVFLQVALKLLEQAKHKAVDSQVVISSEATLPKDLLKNPQLLLEPSRQAARRNASLNNVRQLTLAMFNYESVHKRFPSAVIIDKESGAARSWRVELLPFLGEDELYAQYRKNELWDSEHNKKLIARMPAAFLHPADTRSSFTAYFMPSGPGMVGRKGSGVRPREMSDGTSPTIVLLEAKREIPWTKPEDLDFTGKEPPQLGGFTPDTFTAGFADGSVRIVADDIDPALLRKALTFAGGERFDLD